MDYLGVQLTLDLTFTVNLQKPRQKLFAALNSIFGKVGPNSSPAIILSLIEAQCVPILLYASECIVWKKSLIESLENTLCQAYFKIFRTFDKSIAYQCMYFMGQLPLEFKIAQRKINFLSNLKKTSSQSMCSILKNDNELKELMMKYKLDNSNLHKQFVDIFKCKHSIIC